MKNLLFCFGFLLFAISCSNSQATSNDNSKMNDFEVLYKSEYGGSGEEKTEVFTDQESFTKMWNGSINLYSGSTDVPRIDFSKKMVVSQHFQSRNSGGAEYQIKSVKQSGNKTEVWYSAIGPEEMATMAITAPMIIVVVNKTDDPIVEFKIQK